MFAIVDFPEPGIPLKSIKSPFISFTLSIGEI
jgi:hypothetical protein